MRILADPDYLQTNPYPELLYSELRRQGETVERYTIRKALTEKTDILHFHWPQMAKPQNRGVTASLDFWMRNGVEKIAALPAARARGAKVFWTVHNLNRHDHAASPLEEFFLAQFLKNCDATIHMTNSGRELAFSQIPQLKDRPFFVIPHGLYPDVYNNGLTRKAAREKLGLPIEKKLLVYFGMIRPYKNVSTLLESFLHAAPTDAHLVVAGKVHKSAKGLEANIRNSASQQSNITLMLNFLSDEALQLLAKAADICVFPYREIFNSGSIFYALSAARPSLVPESPVFQELASDFGENWVQCFNGSLTAEILTEALAKIPTTIDRTDKENPDLTQIQWPLIAERTIAAYRSVL